MGIGVLCARKGIFKALNDPNVDSECISNAIKVNCSSNDINSLLWLGSLKNPDHQYVIWCSKNICIIVKPKKVSYDIALLICCFTIHKSLRKEGSKFAGNSNERRMRKH